MEIDFETIQVRADADHKYECVPVCTLMMMFFIFKHWLLQLMN